MLLRLQTVLALAFILIVATAPAQAADTAKLSAGNLPPVTVWRNPGCSCCGKWVKHLRSAGFTVTMTESDKMSAIKRREGVPGNLEACHTAKVGGYTVEGHVPAADIVRLLKERPTAKGLAVAGMPMGSPGMEVRSGRKERFDVILFGDKGTSRTFATHN
jgi:hypothetical protein